MSPRASSSPGPDASGPLGPFPSGNPGIVPTATANGPGEPHEKRTVRCSKCGGRTPEDRTCSRPGSRKEYCEPCFLALPDDANSSTLGRLV